MAASAQPSALKERFALRLDPQYFFIIAYDVTKYTRNKSHCFSKKAEGLMKRKNGLQKREDELSGSQ